MASPQIGNRRHKISLRILLDNDVEITGFGHVEKMLPSFENARIL
jgi:hypothetical protein